MRRIRALWLFVMFVMRLYEFYVCLDGYCLVLWFFIVYGSFISSFSCKFFFVYRGSWNLLLFRMKEYDFFRIIKRSIFFYSNCLVVFLFFVLK